MNAVLFDTLAFARRMEAVGFTRAQAEAMAEEQAKLIDERLATKTDIERIHADIDALRQETKGNIERLRQEAEANIDRRRRETAAEIERLRQETTADIERLRQETRENIERLRQETASGMESLRLTNRSDLAESRWEVVKWTIGAIGVQTVVIITAVIALARSLLH